MYSEAHFVKPHLETSLGKRPTMVVEIEEPPTLTISSDEIIAFAQRCCIILFRSTQKTIMAIWYFLSSLYKKLSALSIRVSFEEEKDAPRSIPKTPAPTRRIAPGQLDLFYESSIQEDGTLLAKDRALQTSLSSHQTTHSSSHTESSILPWVTVGAIGFGLLAQLLVH